MAYVLYGDRRCGNAIVELLLAAADAEVELRRVPLEGDGQLAPGYRAVNPMGRLPALILPDGTLVTESLACALVVAERHQEAGLMPPIGSAERATALRWMTVLAAELYPAITRWDYPARFADDPAGVADRARDDSRRIWRLIETSIAPAPFATGPRFSALDAQIAVMSRWSNGPASWVDAHCPKVAAVTHAVATHPKAGPAYIRHFGPY
ncbi:glutathione S-transferase family protein [Elioraea rosea]|uniref:glutathione S-transferase family protein n=1 Tax=Elioraea rosea TaxID=2492390 RepID=UPI0011822FDF|nr:glutathione S-transferase family protein [Elioraea rosea]